MTIKTATLERAGFSRQAIEELSAQNNEPEWMRARRLEAWHLFEDTPNPAANDELWRRTSLANLDLDSPIAFGGNARPDATSALPEKFQQIVNDQNAGGVLVQYNSTGAHARLASDLKKRGVIFCDLATAIREHSDLVQQYLMTKAVTYSENRYKSDKPRTAASGKHEGGGYGETIGDLKFAALHGAFLSGGTFLYVPRNVVIEMPLQSLTFFDAPNLAIFAHTLIVLEEGAAVKVIENYASQEDTAQRLANGAVELILKPGANLQYFHLQDYAANVWNFTTQTALMEKDTNLTWLVGTLGSGTTKAFLDCKLQGTGANAALLGFFFGDGKQHFDQHTFQHHIAGHTTSDLLYKGTLRDNAYSAFRGLIRVNPNAQRSDAYQANRNLLLSAHAHADSIPELEIEANDVRCTHGATVGPIDPEQMFYLMARGIEKREAERLIVEGFFDPLMQKIPLEAIREELAQVIQKKIGI
ncbi:MAG: Fe-S cluster assembly protein SufD [Chloroflexi bacterium]|nr:Fe-S cluster assembly protein SufD [Chloroflexota bacterium]MBI3740449.1 Fe-S cluster assembly protein SufD [Chloroflexota bacterium]